MVRRLPQTLHLATLGGRRSCMAWWSPATDGDYMVVGDPGGDCVAQGRFQEVTERSSLYSRCCPPPVGRSSFVIPEYIY